MGCPGRLGLAEGYKSRLHQGKAAAILAVLAARSIRVSAEVCAAIEACKDVSMLDHWMAHATTPLMPAR